MIIGKGPFHRRGLMRLRKAEQKEYSLTVSGQEPSYKGIVDRNGTGIDAYGGVNPQKVLALRGQSSLNM